VKGVQRQGKAFRAHLSRWFTRLSELFDLVGSGIGKVDVSVTRQECQQRLFGTKKSGVLRAEPGSMIILGYFVKEGETRIGKLERSTDVGRLVDYGLPQWCEKSLDTRGGCHEARRSR
jgi:hypothetical protein